MPIPRLTTATLIGLALAAITGCSTPVRVERLATGQVEVPAYALSGGDLDTLRAEAARRCPQGAQVLRAAEQDSLRAAPDAGRLKRWLAWSLDQVQPPTRGAQLVVRCEAVTGGDRLGTAPPGPDAAGGRGLAEPAPTRSEVPPGQASDQPETAPPTVAAPTSKVAPQVPPAAGKTKAKTA